jgi:hypothetical protein
MKKRMWLLIRSWDYQGDEIIKHAHRPEDLKIGYDPSRQGAVDDVYVDLGDLTWVAENSHGHLMAAHPQCDYVHYHIVPVDFDGCEG